MRTLKKVAVNKKAENAVRNGHPWVYGEEITHTDGNIAGGEIVDVFSSKNRYLGSGFYNPASKITVRIISTNANDVSAAISTAAGLSSAIRIFSPDLSSTNSVRALSRR